MRRYCLSIVGSHGYRARYGGWDQLVNNLVDHAADFDKTVLVYNSKETPDCVGLIGVESRNFRLHAHGFQGLILDFIAVCDSFFRVNCILFLGAQALPLAVLLRWLTGRKVKFMVNPGGIEWERPKFGPVSRAYLKFVFDCSLRYADTVILDNSHYLGWVEATSKAASRIEIIPYGATIDYTGDSEKVLRSLAVPFGRYYLSVSRALEDNQIENVCECFAKTPHCNLVMISNFSSSTYGRLVHERYRNVPNIRLVDGLYDKASLDALRRGCEAYVHTHTLCGSAPSLIEMIVCGKPIFSIDRPQNRYTLRGAGAMFRDYEELRNQISSSMLPTPPTEDVKSGYGWAVIVKRYFDLI